VSALAAAAPWCGSKEKSMSAVADRLQELLLRITRAHGPRLLLDLSAVSFMDCAGRRALVRE
jgi:anti-anti-sigma regulatory factor